MPGCSNDDCDEEFGYDDGFDDPPKGEGHIAVVHNPADEPSYVVGQRLSYCSVSCLQDDDRVPDYLLDGDEDGDQA